MLVIQCENRAVHMKVARIIMRLQMRRKRYQSLNMMKHSFHPGTLHRNDAGIMVDTML